jgi:hypothetical protein
MQWYLEKYNRIKPDELRHEARILTKLLRAPIHKKKLWAEKRGIWRAQREHIISLLNHHRTSKKTKMENQTQSPVDVVKQAQTLLTLHNFTGSCLKQNLQPIVLLSIQHINNEAVIAANVTEGIGIEQVIEVIEHSLIGLKQQANTTPSGIIKSI